VENFPEVEDPKILGYTQALQAVIKEAKKSHDLLKGERIPFEQGKMEACKQLAAQVDGLIAQLRNEAEAGNVPGSEVIPRRDLLVKARVLIESFHTAALTEVKLLQGEARAIQRQVDLVAKLLADKLKEEERKRRIADEMRDEARRREEIPAASTADTVDTPTTVPSETTPESVDALEVTQPNVPQDIPSQNDQLPVVLETPAEAAPSVVAPQPQPSLQSLVRTRSRRKRQ